MSDFSIEIGREEPIYRKIDEILKQLFPNVKITLERVNYGGYISVFIVNIDNEEVLSGRWKEISSSIAAYYQAHLFSDFEKWNVYLIYKCKEKIDIGLTYKIENDKFSSRKIVHIVEEKHNKKLLDNILVANYITNKDLELKQDSYLAPENYESKSELWPFISNGNIKLVKNSLKDVEIVLTKIENFLSYED